MKKKEKLKNVINLDSQGKYKMNNKLSLSHETISILNGDSPQAKEATGPASILTMINCWRCFTKPSWCDIFSPGENWTPCNTWPGRGFE